LNFKFHRQAMDKVVGISDQAAGFLSEYFSYVRNHHEAVDGLIAAHDCFRHKGDMPRLTGYYHNTGCSTSASARRSAAASRIIALR
jgi:hypothetical protein